MNKYVVTFLMNGRKSEIIIGSAGPASAFQTVKLMFPNAFVIKATRE